MIASGIGREKRPSLGSGLSALLFSFRRMYRKLQRVTALWRQPFVDFAQVVDSSGADHLPFIG
jgi:hypothetical protein